MKQESKFCHMFKIVAPDGNSGKRHRISDMLKTPVI